VINCQANANIYRNVVPAALFSFWLMFFQDTTFYFCVLLCLVDLYIILFNSIHDPSTVLFIEVLFSRYNKSNVKTSTNNNCFLLLTGPYIYYEIVKDVGDRILLNIQANGLENTTLNYTYKLSLQRKKVYYLLAS
jgi:hypothetical protein